MPLRNRGFLQTLALILGLVPGTLSAQHRGLYLDLATGASDHVYTGMAFTGGVTYQTGPMLASLHAVDVILSPGDALTDHAEVCENGNEGVFGDQQCSPMHADYGVSGDLAFLLPGTPLFLGGGARVGGESRWYGTAVVTWGKASRMQYKVQARIGRDYLAAMIGLGLRL